MRELVRSLEGRMDVRDVRGLARRRPQHRRAWKNAPRPLEDDLDTLPNPARDLVPLARYLAFDSHASVVTSRGCPYECIFCSAPAWTGRKVRYRDPVKCVDEIEELARLGFTEITIEDDLFTLYRKHFLAVCGELIDRNTGIRWNAFSRVDTITPEIVDTMAKAGCQAICFGVESGNQEVLDLIKKNSNLAKVKEAMRMAQDAGICALASFIVGLPGETEETLRKTVEFAEELQARVRLALRLPHPVAVPGHRSAREGGRVRTRDPEQRLDPVRRQSRRDAHGGRESRGDPGRLRPVRGHHRALRRSTRITSTPPGSSTATRRRRSCAASARRCSGSCCSTRWSSRCRRWRATR